jgi:hypothetical protein
MVTDETAERRAFKAMQAGVATEEDRELVAEVLKRGTRTRAQELSDELAACRARIKDLARQIAAERLQERNLEAALQYELHPPKVLPYIKGYDSGGRTDLTAFGSNRHIPRRVNHAVIAPAWLAARLPTGIGTAPFHLPIVHMSESSSAFASRSGPVSKPSLNQA